MYHALMKTYRKSEEITLAQKRRKNTNYQAAFRRRCQEYYKGLEEIVKRLDDQLLELIKMKITANPCFKTSK